MTETCSDKRLGDKLYAYELGLLDEAEREQVELHLMDCEHCFARAEKFAEAAGLLRDSESVRAEVANSETSESQQGKRSGWGTLARVSLAAAAVFVILLLKPWQFEIRPDLQALAAENRLAVATFEYSALDSSDAMINRIVSELLIADLSESRYLQVVSSRRMNDLRDLLRKQAADSEAPVSPTRLAERASARWLLDGRIERTDSGWTVVSELSDVGTGVVVGSRRLQGKSEAALFGLVDQLSVAVRADLGLTSDNAEEYDPAVADVTTHSLEAYRWYLSGLQNLEKLYRAEAVGDFHRALEHDSTFAMAYYHLATWEDRDLLDQAIKYASGATRREQHYIRASQARAAHEDETYKQELDLLLSEFPDEKEAYYLLGSQFVSEGNPDSAIVYFRKAIEIDPLYKMAHNQLVYAHNSRGDFPGAIEAINRYIELAPDEPNPYDTRGDIFAANGELERANESYRQAATIRPEFMASTSKLAVGLIYAGEYDESASIIDQLETASGFNTRYTGRILRSYWFAYQGKLKAAVAWIDEASEASALELAVVDSAAERSTLTRIKADLLSLAGDAPGAVASIREAITINDRRFPEDSLTYRYLLVQYLSEYGALEEARQVAETLRACFAVTEVAPCYRLWAAGQIARAEQNWAVAIDSLEAAIKYTQPSSDFYGHFLLARTYLEAGRVGEAVPLFEQLSSAYTVNRIGEIGTAATLPYYLGRSYEASNWLDRAAEQYALLLEQWSDADTDLPLLRDARTRLDRLSATP